MKTLPRISESEWEVMRVIWQRSPITANEVVDELAETTDWKPKTIKTLVNRLLKKKALGFKRRGRTYLYHPLVDEVECIRAESCSFLGRVYGGALIPMLAHFLEHENLSEKELDELRRILDERGK